MSTLENTSDVAERFRRLSEDMPPEDVQFRRDSDPIQRGPKIFARAVAFVSAQAVQRRLDQYFAGDWQSELTLLPERANDDGEVEVALKARLTILGLSREDVGTGTTYKNAASDALKRAAVRFGIGAHLYDMEVNWVEVDSLDKRKAKFVEDPAAAYARRYGGRSAPPKQQQSPVAPGRGGTTLPAAANGGVGELTPSPDTKTRPQRVPASSSAAARAAVDAAFPPPLIDQPDDLPF